MLHQKIEIDLSKVQPLDEEMKTDHGHESILVGCVPLVCKLYVQPECHSLGWVGFEGAPQVNKFEQIFSVDHQMSVAVGLGLGPRLM